MSLRWSLRLHDTALVQSIERESGLSPVIAQLLALRGYLVAGGHQIVLQSKNDRPSRAFGTSRARSSR